MKGGLNHTYKLEPYVSSYDNGDVVSTYKIDLIYLNQKELKEGIEITWLADDTEFEIWFPKELNSITFPWYQRFFRNRSGNKQITRKFRGNFKLDPESKLVIYYSIFCSKTDSMAIGGSSPRMIIRS